MTSPTGDDTGRSRLHRAGVAVGGGATVLVGLALLPLPGPGSLVVLGGLAVLRKEFPVAGAASDRLTSGARRVASTAGRAARTARRRVTATTQALAERRHAPSGPERPER